MTLDYLAANVLPNVPIEKQSWSSVSKYQTLVGIYSGKHVWYWFQLCFDGSLLFDHAYSQNTGKTFRGWSKAKVGYRLLEKFIN